MISNDLGVKILSFIGASLAVVAQATDPLDPRTIAGAVSVGCGAVLALSRSPGQRAVTLPPAQVEDEQREARVRQVREAGGRG